MLFKYIGSLHILLFMKERAKKLSNAYCAVQMEWNEPWSIICIIHNNNDMHNFPGLGYA